MENIKKAVIKLLITVFVVMFFSHALHLRALQGDSAYGPHGVYVPGKEVYVPGGARREGLARRTARRTGYARGYLL